MKSFDGNLTWSDIQPQYRALYFELINRNPLIKGAKYYFSNNHFYQEKYYIFIAGDELWERKLIKISNEDILDPIEEEDTI